MDKLDVYSLSFIFKNLDLIDLMNCSNVCVRWKQIINLKNLFICYGIGFLPEKNFHSDFLRFHQKQSSKPHFITDDSIFDYLKKDFFKNVEIFIIHENLNLKLVCLFNFKMLPNLKYLEIRDYFFCETIFNEFKRFFDKNGLKEIVSSKFYNSSIETLVMKNINLMMLFTCFPNLKNLKLSNFYINVSYVLIKNYKMKKLKSISLHYSSIDLFDLIFFIKKCPLLNSIEVKNYYYIELTKLMEITKLKNISIQFFDSEFLDFKPVILKYENRLNTDCKLYIKNLQIKNSKDFENLVKQFKFRENLLENNKEYIHIYDSCFIINNYLGIEAYKNLKNHSIFDCIKYVNICNENNFEDRLPEIFSVLPKILKSLRIISKNIIPEEVFKLIPQHFPFLKILHLSTKKSTISNCEFISNLNYLYAIELNYLNLDFISLVLALERLNFINEIKIDFIEKDIFKVLNSFKGFFERKKNSFTIRLSLNEKKYTLYKIRTILRKNKI